MAHDLLSPSAAARWLVCTASPRLISTLPEEESSVYAEEGTKAHEQAALAVEAVFKGETFVPTTDDADMIRHASSWAAMLRRQFIRRLPAIVRVEKPLDISGVTHRPGARGTADFLAITTEGRLVIADFKYGMGVEVEAEQNPQLSIYALAAMDEYGFALSINAVRLIIYQPRISSEPKIYDWDMEALRDFRARVEVAAARCETLLTDPEYEKYLVPGEAQCRFCRAKAICPALRAKTKEVIAADFDVVPAAQAEQTLKLPETPEQLSRALAWLDPIEQWCAAVRASALSRLEAGETVPGWKVVAGRKGPRKWAAGAEEQILRMRIPKSVLYKKTLISPAQAERAVAARAIGESQWRRMEALVTQADGKPTVVKESDKRPALSPVASEFKEVGNA